MTSYWFLAPFARSSIFYNKNSNETGTLYAEKRLFKRNANGAKVIVKNYIIDLSQDIC